MRILGLDPGSQVTGFGVVEKHKSHFFHVDNGGVFTEPKMPFASKLKTLFRGVKELIETYKPDAVAIETIFYSKNIRSAFQLGHARGALMVAASDSGLSVFEYSPLEIKQAVAGYGRATKEQIQQMVKHLLGLPETTYYDASDALAVALCHLQSEKLSSFIKNNL